MEIFLKKKHLTIDDLLVQENQEEIRKRFFSLVRRSERHLYDHMCENFLEAVHGPLRRILDTPELFAAIIIKGSLFADARLYYGIEYFRRLKEGELGNTPDQLRFLLEWLGRLNKIDLDLSYAFLKGYWVLFPKLTFPQIEQFVAQGIHIFEGSYHTGLKFLSCTTQTAETFIRNLSRFCSLDQIVARLSLLLRALTGSGIQVESANNGPAPACKTETLVLPEKIDRFAAVALNRSWYFLQTVTAAGAYACNSIPRAGSLVSGLNKNNILRNLLFLCEYLRILIYIRKRWSGCRDLVNFGLAVSRQKNKNAVANSLFWRLHDQQSEKNQTDAATLALMGIIGQSRSAKQSLEMLRQLKSSYLQSMRSGLGTGDFLPPDFMPLFLPDNEVMQEEAPWSNDPRLPATFQESGKGEKSTVDLPAAGGPSLAHSVTQQVSSVGSQYLYDEWSSLEGAYYANHCILREYIPTVNQKVKFEPSLSDRMIRTRKLFELLKPLESSRKKRLQDGDSINHDLLIDYLVDTRRNPSPRIDFYERPLVIKRSLSVVILLDVSGSTDEDIKNEKILDREKEAAYLLSQGMADLGDRFSLCGFSGFGRKDCRYYVYKDFDDSWDELNKARLWQAEASSSTRIGVALRHAGARLQKEAARQRLILLITDGRPMDQGYDPDDGYAQHDVRMAGEENARLNITTFCVSTMENRLSEMELMFPAKKFVVLESMRHLPEVLPELYIRLTT